MVTGVPSVISGDHVFFRRLGAARLERGDGLVQHLLVKLVADFFDMSGLFVAEQIAGAANVEIVAGELEARAKRVERLQHFEPLLRLRRDRLVDRRGEQGVGAGFRASDAAAQLIKLRKAEHVGAIDDQGIGGRNIEAGFDDIGRDQHIIFAVIEGADALFQFGRRPSVHARR